MAGHLLGELQTSGSTSTTNFFLTDGLGSVLGAFSNTANSAALLSTQLFTPYGSQLVSNGNSIGQYTAKGFTGQYADAVSGLDYYVSRYYDPVAGVFLSADKATGNAQGMNPYDYVGNNPETENDPTGQYFAPPGGGGNGNPNPPPCNPAIENCGTQGSGYNSGSANNCTDTNCSVTLGSGHTRHTFTLNDLMNLSQRSAFIQAFYDMFAATYGTAELDFFNFLLNSQRLLRSAYWNSVDYQLARDQLLAAYDFLHHMIPQSLMVKDWLAFLSHPSNDSWWIAHNASIDEGDHVARVEGLYAKESFIEQHFINETVNVINSIQVISQGSWNPFGKVFSPTAPTTGELAALFYPQQYSDISDVSSIVEQSVTAGLGGFTVGGLVGSIAGLGAFTLELF